MDNLVSQGHYIEGDHATAIKLQLVQKHKKYIGSMAYIILKYLEIKLCSYFKNQWTVSLIQFKQIEIK
jgi:hypothetical protein